MKITPSAMTSMTLSFLPHDFYSFADMVVDKKFNNHTRFRGNKNTLLKTGIIVSIGLALHNFPEGLAIRVRF